MSAIKGMVTLIERDMGRRIYTVQFDGREYNATHAVARDVWHILNDRGNALSPQRGMWGKVVALCEQFSRDIDL